MHSLQRVLTTLRHEEPDRVPLFLLFSCYGARELGVPIRDYFAHPEHVVEAQLRLARKYHNDCLYTFFHAALEVEAWGGTVIFSEDGPPNAGEPFIRHPEQIRSLQPPSVADAPGLRRVLEATRRLAERNRGQRPLIGVVIAPFSLPVMQLGFETYLQLMHEQPALLDQLLRLNEHFCTAWANAQLAAGATAICFFNPLASPTILAREQYLRLGHASTLRTLSQINGPTVFHFASGRCLPVLDDLATSGVLALGVSNDEDLAGLKRAAAGRVALFGNLNGIAMRRWSESEAEQQVKTALAAAAPGGGFILADNHGEIPMQVGEQTLLAIAEAVQRWGTYPLKWLPHEF
jgi:uroporphyrinogen decarboxylase